MRGLISFSMNKVPAMIILIVLLFGTGLYSATSLKIENQPDVSFPMVMVTTSYAASPQDVMSEVTEPIEDKLASLEELDSISSTSSDGVSTISLSFEQGADTDQKKQDIDSLLQQLSLPAEASSPVTSTMGFASIPSYYFALSGTNGMTQSDLDQIFSDDLEPVLESLNGIDHLDSIGSRETSLEIKLNANALTSFGLTPTQVTNAISAFLTSESVGTMEVNGNSQMARVTGNLETLYDLENMEIKSGQKTLLLKDLADISAVNDAEFVSTLNGEPAIGINLYKASDANAVDFSNEITKVIDKWEKQYPDISFKKVYDSADEVRASIKGLVKEGLIGVFLAALIILLFLRHIRMTLIVLVSIPLSILITLILMNALGLTLNVMSLGGMFIAVGRIVDDSIVVIENIFRSLQQAQERKQSVILLATKQVAMAISSSTIVTVGVFLPIAFVSGVIGGFFRPFALTVACSLMASLLVALTVIPMLAKLLVLKQSKNKEVHHEEKEGKLEKVYVRLLQWCLKHRIKTLLLSAVIFIFTLVATVPNLAINFLSESKADNGLSFKIKLPYETSFETTELQVNVIDTMLTEAKDEEGQPLFTFTEALVGYDGDDERVAYSATIYTEVNETSDVTQVKNEYTNLILRQLPKGSEVTAGSLSGGGGGFSSTDFSYQLIGDDQDRLTEAAALVTEKLAEFPEIKDVEDTLGDSKLEVEIAVSQTKATQLGLDASTVSSEVRNWLADQDMGDVKLDGVLYSTTIGLSTEDKNSLDLLGKMKIQTDSGKTVFLDEIADIQQVEAPASLTREDRKQTVTVTASIDAENKSAISSQISMELAQLQLPDGVSTSVGGVSEDINEGFTQLFLAMAVAIAIVYFVMVLCFGNASTPFAILFSLPFAAVGGLYGLLFTGEPLNISSLIGFMMLIGIVVTNAIVLLDRTQQLLAEGYTVRHAIIEAGKVRLRPIIMTAAATVVAMIPLAIGFGSEGNLISRGLAVVVIGGLTVSTFLTLLVVPVIYELLESIKRRLLKRSYHTADIQSDM